MTLPLTDAQISDLVTNHSAALHVTLPWQYGDSWFTVAVESVTLATGDDSHSGETETVVVGEVNNVIGSPEVKVGDAGEWRMIESEWAQMLAGFLRMSPTTREVLGTLRAAFTDRPHVKVDQRTAPDGREIVYVADTREEGLIAELWCAGGPRWTIDPEIDPADLRDIGSEA